MLNNGDDKGKGNGEQQQEGSKTHADKIREHQAGTSSDQPKQEPTEERHADKVRKHLGKPTLAEEQAAEEDSIDIGVIVVWGDPLPEEDDEEWLPAPGEAEGSIAAIRQAESAFGSGK